ncbi:GUAD deaminase, partial [Polypterus senegalus]|nr:GUAD deaminase [Polypterus senegalus]
MSRSAAAGQVQHVFKGTFAHSTIVEPLQILDNTILGVDINGKIAFIEHGDQEAILCEKWGFSSSDVKTLQDKHRVICSRLRRNKKYIRKEVIKEARNGQRIECDGGMENCDTVEHKAFRRTSYSEHSGYKLSQYVGAMENADYRLLKCDSEVGKQTQRSEDLRLTGGPVSRITKKRNPATR